MTYMSDSRFKELLAQQAVKNFTSRLRAAQGKAIRKQPEQILIPQVQFMTQIVESRRKQHVSQAQLAKLVGTSQSAIANIETGRNNPSLSIIFKITQALGLTISLG